MLDSFYEGLGGQNIDVLKFTGVHVQNFEIYKRFRKSQTKYKPAFPNLMPMDS